MTTSTDRRALLALFEGNRHGEVIARAPSWLADHPDDGVVLALVAAAHLALGDQHGTLAAAWRAPCSGLGLVTGWVARLVAVPGAWRPWWLPLG